jgi:DNA-binding CsgD family transcriptional regulator
MAPRTVIVAHPERMVAEGIAAGLARYPGLIASAVTSAGELRARAHLVDAVALHAEVHGAEAAAALLRRGGVRVVFVGDHVAEDEGIRVPTCESIGALASALAPGVAAPARARGRLTAREEQILRLVSRGLAGKQVARQLGISPKTVERHKTRIFAKLGVANQAAAVNVAFATGSLAEVG